MMRTLIASTLAAGALASGLALAAPANAAQGGNDTSGAPANAHSWMKVSRDELRGKTVDTACNEIYALRGVPGGCSNLIVRIVGEKQRNPNANGYWAENYYNNKPYATARSGTW